MKTGTRTLKEAGKAGEVSTSRKVTPRAGKPAPDGIKANPKRGKLSPKERKKLDALLVDKADKGDLAEVRRLLKAGADPDARNEYRKNALGAAAWNGHTKIVKLLIDKGADVNSKSGSVPIIIASAGEPEMLKLLIDAGALVDAEDEYRWSDADAPLGRTALMAAVMFGIVESAKILIAAGADPNKKDCLGNTAIILAIKRGRKEMRTEMVKLLIDSGASVNVRDTVGLTPLLYAFLAYDREIIRLLVERGAEVNEVHVSSGYKIRPLHLAIELRYGEIAELMKAHGAEM